MEVPQTNSDVLNSWKEVAGYLGRGVRTVQRWEQELSLPVRRPRGKSRSAIIAFRSELDAWLQQSSLHHPAVVGHDHPAVVGHDGLPPTGNDALSPAAHDAPSPNERRRELH